MLLIGVVSLVNAFVTIIRFETNIWHLQSKHRCLYTPPQPCQNKWMTIGSTEGFPGVHTHCAVCLLLLQWQTGLAGSDFVYSMHFTHYSVQWHLTKFKMKYIRFLLNDSTCEEQWPSKQAHFKFLKYINHLVVYTKGAITYQLSIPPICIINSDIAVRWWCN